MQGHLSVAPLTQGTRALRTPLLPPMFWDRQRHKELPPVSCFLPLFLRRAPCRPWLPTHHTLLQHRLPSCPSSATISLTFFVLTFLPQDVPFSKVVWFLIYTFYTACHLHRDHRHPLWCLFPEIPNSGNLIS